MKNLRITLPASQDLDEISDYFLAQSIDAGDRFVDVIDDDVEILRVVNGYRNLQDVFSE